jgi:hypothetical protein
MVLVKSLANLKWLTLCCLAVLHFGCAYTKSLDTEVISPAKMAAIIADLKIIDAAKQSGIFPSSLQDTVDIAPNDSTRLNKILSRKKLRNKKLLQTETIQKVESTKDTNASEIALAYKDSILNYVPEPEDPTKLETPKIFIPHLGAEYDMVFKKHGVTRTQFEEALSTYGKEPKVFFAICEEALNILNLQHALLEQSMQSEKTQ